MFCTVDTESSFHICLGPAQEAALEAALLSNYRALLDAFAHIDVTKAQASPEDTALIMGAIERLPGGANGLNGLAMDQMSAWAKQKAREMVEARRNADSRLVEDEEKLALDTTRLQQVNTSNILAPHLSVRHSSWVRTDANAQLARSVPFRTGRWCVREAGNKQGERVLGMMDSLDLFAASTGNSSKPRYRGGVASYSVQEKTSARER
jgi:hypothetical protein